MSICISIHLRQEFHDSYQPCCDWKANTGNTNSAGESSQISGLQQVRSVLTILIFVGNDWGPHSGRFYPPTCPENPVSFMPFSEAAAQEFASVEAPLTKDTLGDWTWHPCKMRFLLNIIFRFHINYCKLWEAMFLIRIDYWICFTVLLAWFDTLECCIDYCIMVSHHIPCI